MIGFGAIFLALNGRTIGMPLTVFDQYEVVLNGANYIRYLLGWI